MATLDESWPSFTAFRFCGAIILTILFFQSEPYKQSIMAFSRKKKKEYLRSRPEESDGRVTNIPQPGNHLPTKTINSDTISLCAFFILAKVIFFQAMNFYVRSIILLEGHHHIKQKTVQVSFSWKTARKFIFSLNLHILSKQIHIQTIIFTVENSIPLLE